MKAKIINVSKDAKNREYWSKYIGKIFDIVKQDGTVYHLNMKKEEGGIKIWNRAEIEIIEVKTNETKKH